MNVSLTTNARSWPARGQALSAWLDLGVEAFQELVDRHGSQPAPGSLAHVDALTITAHEPRHASAGPWFALLTLTGAGEMVRALAALYRSTEYRELTRGLWVPNIRSWVLTRHDVLRSSSVVYRILYRFLAAMARLAVRSGRSKDLEIIVLRHQLMVLQRQDDRPELNDSDRSLLGAIARALPRPRRAGWLVTPDTLLRWHRRRIARRWTLWVPETRSWPPEQAFREQQSPEPTLSIQGHGCRNRQRCVVRSRVRQPMWRARETAGSTATTAFSAPTAATRRPLEAPGVAISIRLHGVRDQAITLRRSGLGW